MTSVARAGAAPATAAAVAFGLLSVACSPFDRAAAPDASTTASRRTLGPAVLVPALTAAALELGRERPELATRPITAEYDGCFVDAL